MYEVFLNQLRHTKLKRDVPELYFITPISLKVKPQSHQSDVLTAFPQRSKKVADRRGARCAVAVWRLHSVLNSALWKRCGNAAHGVV